MTRPSKDELPFVAWREMILNEKWDELAALSYQQYLAEGRGIVVVFSDAMPMKHGARRGVGFGIGYMTEEEAAQEWGAETMEAVRTYNPAQEFLASFVGGETVQVGLIAREKGLTPKEAFERGFKPVDLTPESLGMGRGN